MQMRTIINVPGLIGEGCKYSTFHHCMLDFNHDMQKGFGDLRVGQVGLESRVDENAWKLTQLKTEVKKMLKSSDGIRLECSRLDSELLGLTAEVR